MFVLQNYLLTSEHILIRIPVVWLRRILSEILPASLNNQDNVLVDIRFSFLGNTGDISFSAVPIYHFCGPPSCVVPAIDPLRIFRFFCDEESIWSEITNPFSDSPPRNAPASVLIFRISQGKLFESRCHVSYLNTSLTPFSLHILKFLTRYPCWYPTWNP